MSCSAAQSALRAVSTVQQVSNATQGSGGSSSSSSLLSTISLEDTLQAVLAAILNGVSEVFEERQRFYQALAITMDELALTQQAGNYGLPMAIQMICTTPGPDDLPQPGPEVELPDEEMDDIALFRATGEIDENSGLVSVEIAARPAEAEEWATVTIRGGGWLLCALFESELHVDGELLRLDGSLESLEPTLDVAVWPDDPEAVELPTAVEVTMSFSLPLEVVAELLEAEELTFWIDDEALDLYPADSEPAQQLLDYLFMPSPEETELPEEILEQLVQ